jgi:hypothetical protein
MQSFFTYAKLMKKTQKIKMLVLTFLYFKYKKNENAWTEQQLDI